MVSAQSICSVPVYTKPRWPMPQSPKPQAGLACRPRPVWGNTQHFSCRTTGPLWRFDVAGMGNQQGMLIISSRRRRCMERQGTHHANVNANVHFGFGWRGMHIHFGL